MNNSGVLLAPGAVDTPLCATDAFGYSTAQVVTPGMYPFVTPDSNPHWVPNTSTAQWIAPNPNNGVPNGAYDYTTTFTIGPGANLSSVLITGLVTSDDKLANVTLNGNSLGITTPSGETAATSRDSTPCIRSRSAAVTDFFHIGVNTLTFDTLNQFGSVTGLIVQITGSYSLVPEPTSMAAAGHRPQRSTDFPPVPQAPRQR